MTAMALQQELLTPSATTQLHAINGSVCADVREVSLSFGGQRILEEASLELRAGEIVLLRGENGSGKTTLLNMLSGYLAPDRGTVRLLLGGKWVNAHQTSPERLARLGVGRLWQDIRLFPTMTVLDNVLAATPRLIGGNPLLALAAFPLAIRQQREARKCAIKNLAIVAMEGRASSSCDMLSVGQMKRVAIARLLQTEASLLLLDEPLAGLDTASSKALVRDLERLSTEHGKTILIVEHRHEQISSIADRVLSLQNGQIKEVDAHGV